MTYHVAKTQVTYPVAKAATLTVPHQLPPQPTHPIKRVTETASVMESAHADPFPPYRLASLATASTKCVGPLRSPRPIPSRAGFLRNRITT